MQPPRPHCPPASSSRSLGCCRPAPGVGPEGRSAAVHSQKAPRQPHPAPSPPIHSERAKSAVLAADGIQHGRRYQRRTWWRAFRSLLNEVSVLQVPAFRSLFFGSGDKSDGGNEGTQHPREAAAARGPQLSLNTGQEPSTEVEARPQPGHTHDAAAEVQHRGLPAAAVVSTKRSERKSVSKTNTCILLRVCWCARTRTHAHTHTSSPT